MDDRIDILLATYNGERFLAEQLDSVIAQSHTNWRILARDDGSSDGTVDLLKAYRARHPGRLDIVEDGRGNLGSVGNFSALLEASTAPYVAFCDQDDVWRPEKLALGLASVKELEGQWGMEMPCLSFSDLTVVDEGLAPIASSFWHRENLDPTRAGVLSRLLAQNVITGCTAVLNRSLADLATPIPPDAMVHDWWVALTAAAFGRVKAVPQATMLYRQHGGNETGSRGYAGAAGRWARALLAAFGRDRPDYAGRFHQADAFRRRFEQRLDLRGQAVIDGFLGMAGAGLPRRVIIAWRGRFLPTGLARVVGFMVFFRANSKG